MLRFFKFFFVFAFSFSFCLNFSEPIFFDEDVVEISCDKSGNIVVSTDKSIYSVIDCVSKKLVSSKFKIAPKVLISDGFVFFNTGSCEFKKVDLNGKEVFSVELPYPSRSDIIEIDDNIVFSLTNGSLCCFSKDGKMLWMNNYFCNKDYVSSKSKVKTDGKNLFFLSSRGLYIVEPLSGFFSKFLGEFKNSFTIYCDDYGVYSVSHHDFASYSPSVDKKYFSEVTDFPEVFVSHGTNFSYSRKNNSLICECDDMRFEKKFNAHKFKFFEGLVFLISNSKGLLSSMFCVVDGRKFKQGKDPIEIHTIGFNVDELFYKNGKLIVSDGRKIRISNI